MKKLVSVSLGASRLDYEFTARLWDRDFLVRRLGTDGDLKEAARLVREHDGQVDCIALGGMSVSFTVAGRTWHHKDTLRIARQARHTPVVGGRSLKKIVDRWAIREVARRRPGIFDGKNVLFLSGIAHWDIVSVMQEFTDHMAFGDPVLHWGTPAVLRSIEAFGLYARTAMPFLTRRPYVSFFPRGDVAEGIQQRELASALDRADVVVGDARMLRHYAPRRLHGKIVVTDRVDDDALEAFRLDGVDLLVTTSPEVFPERRADMQILHAAVIAHLTKKPGEITDEDYLHLLRALDARPRLIQPRGEVKPRRKFAWLYYPPGRLDLFRDPRVRWLRAAPDELQRSVERAAARLPIRVVAPVRGIQGEGGVEAEGWVLYLPATAGQISARGPAYARRRLQEAARIAHRLGAEVIGVGAFSREMTQATADVAARLELPITSGASMLVSANLWAAKQAVLAMGIAQDDVGRAQGTAVVVGAGDPRGGVAAELIALVFARVVLVDREPDKLLELAERIGARSPHCQVEVATTLAGRVADADLIIAGVAPGWPPVDLDTVRPGAVVCDFARPAHFGPEAVERRPDVVILKSGELELPGPAEVGIALGPPAKTAFASLAEVVVLALEGRLECFTLGDDVTLDGVKAMYKLGLKHGLRLAGMRGAAGPLGDMQIALIREHAEAARRASDLPPATEE